MTDNKSETSPVHGDFVGQDRVTTGNISGTSGVAIGRGAQASVIAQASVVIGTSTGNTIRSFALLYEQIKSRPLDPDTDKDELAELVQKIQRECTKGDEANLTKVERWLKSLAEQADDIYRETVTLLASPSPSEEVPNPVRKTAQKLQKEFAPMQGLSFVDLHTIIDASDLPPNQKTDAHAMVDTLSSQIERGENADVRTIRQVLTDISNLGLPELRKHLMRLLLNSEETSTTIKIFARKLL